jgi:hypothetical protein
MAGVGGLMKMHMISQLMERTYGQDWTKHSIVHCKLLTFSKRGTSYHPFWTKIFLLNYLEVKYDYGTSSAQQKISKGRWKIQDPYETKYDW